MNTMLIKFIKPVFIGVITLIALFAGITQAVAQIGVPASPAQLTCTNSITTKDGIVTFTAEVGDGVNALRDEFCAGAPNGPNDPKECTAFDYSLSANLNGQPATISTATISISTVREVHAISSGLLGEGGANGFFELRTWQLQNPGDPETVTVDGIQEPGLVTVTANVKAGKGKGSTSFHSCSILGPGPSINVLPDSPAATTVSCHNLGDDGAVSYLVRRNPNGKVLPTNGIRYFLFNDFCNEGLSPNPGSLGNGFPGDETGPNQGLRSAPGSRRSEVAVIKKGLNTPTKAEFVKSDGTPVAICYDLDNWSDGAGLQVDTTCNPNLVGFDPDNPQNFFDRGCDVFCEAGAEGGNCTGSNYDCTFP